MNRTHHEDPRTDRSRRHRHRHSRREEVAGSPSRLHGSGARRERVELTAEGFPAATPDAPKPSPVVLVTGDSRARYPWLPARVIAGSVWHGSNHLRVRIDANGVALPWRAPRTAPAG